MRRGRPASLPRIGLEVVRHLHLIEAETTDQLFYGRTRRSLEPCGRAPWIGRRHRNQSMMDRVVVYVVRSREIGLLGGELRVPIQMPDLASWRSVATIDFPRGNRVQ